MQIIKPDKFITNINTLWAKQWLLLSCGDYQAGNFNTMTVGWGYFGIMWARPAAVVVVRPTRYTYEFMNKYETFTLCALPAAFKEDLQYLGSHSGRDGDKISHTKLNITASDKVAAPCFREAELVVECKIIYRDDFRPENFLDPLIDKNYPMKDYHRFFYGEIQEIRGVDKYCG